MLPFLGHDHLLPLPLAENTTMCRLHLPALILLLAAWQPSCSAAGHPLPALAHAGSLAVFLLACLSLASLLYVLHLNRRLRLSEGKLRELATHDELTGLPNRMLFVEFARKVLANSNRHGSLFGLLYMDLDGFKSVNDKHGHKTGDQVLQAVATRIDATIRQGDMAARVGGDEFIVLLDSIRGRASVERATERLLAALGAPLEIDGTSFAIGSSIGAAIFPYDGESLDELIQKADQALLAAKQAGKGRCAFFDELPKETVAS